jgi:thiamine transport system permease protein
MNRTIRAIIALLIWGLAALFIGWPVVRILTVSVQRSAFHEIASDSRIRAVAWFSLWQAVVSTIVSALIAVIVARVLSQFRFRGRALVLAMLSAPFALPTVVVGTAFLVASPRSLHQTATLIIAAHVYFNVGYIARSLLSALDNLDANTNEAARTLGASPRRAFLSIDLRLISGTLRRCCGVVFGLCFSAFGTVLILGGPRRSTLDVEIHRQALQFGRLDRSAVVAILQFVVVLGVIASSRRQPNGVRPTRAGRPTQPKPLRTASEFFTVGSVAAGILAFTALPLAPIVRRAFRNPDDGAVGLSNVRGLARVTRGSGLVETPLRSIAVSLQSALLVCVLSCVVSAVITTVSTFRATNEPVPRVARWLATTMGTAPLAISSITLGLGVLIGFDRSPIAWRSAIWMVPVVQTVVCLPFTIAISLAAAQSLAPGSFHAASTLGAKPFTVWRTIWLPLMRRPFRIGAGTAFCVALGEFGAASLLALPTRETMPLAIARLAQRPGTVFGGQAAALTLILAILTVAVTALSLRTPGKVAA